MLAKRRALFPEGRGLGVGGKERIRMELRIREVDEGGGGLTETRVSEAKGPFPGGKRVGSWGKRGSKKERKR